MALKKCKECAREISTKAESCPGCGARQPKQTSLFTWLVLGVIVLLVLISMSGPDSPSPAVERHEASKQKSEEEIRRDRDLQRAVIAAKGLRAAMRNPDSFTVEQILAMESGAICFTYRAQNGFGGMNREQAVLSSDDSKFVSSPSDGFSKAWNSACAGQTGDDITRLVDVYF